MKRPLYLGTLSFLVLLLFVSTAGAQANEQAVSIGDFFFDPAQITVVPGSTVTWTNQGNEPHTVTADNGLFDSGELYPGDSFSVWLDGSGTVTYHCELHPGMQGSVVVGEAGGEEGANPPNQAVSVE